MHQVHHSSEEYNVTVASRGLVVDTTLLSRPLFYALPLFGVSPLQFLVVILATNVWGIAQHTRLVGKLPFFDWWFATPSNHRVHHGYNPEYIDRNYGEFLVVWDRLFGTYQHEGAEPTYGVIQPVGSYNPWTIQVAGFRWLAAKVRGAKGWREKIRCLYLPPEWKPATESPGCTPSSL
jgi:sterol desaturase/sphingolipid hydroxylase (fatty acid hydroxylase superfamily)